MFTCEINDFCNKVLDYWFPKTERYHDIKQTDFRKWRGKIDVLSGGPPCQAVSLAGKRKGDRDDRFLWDEFIRAVREIQPTWIVAENVYGILSMVESSETPYVEGEATLPMEGYGETERVGQRYVLWKILDEIEKEGYETLPIVIPACAVGAPHRRDRVWFVANRDSVRFGRRQNKQESISWRKSKANYSVSRQNGAIADTCCHRDPSQKESEGIETSRRRNISQSEKRGDKAEWIDGFHRISHDAADTQCDRSDKICENVQSEISNGKRIDSNGLQWNDTLCQSIPADRWKDFPTQSPVCSGDDELSTRLDGITFSKWRQESIKAYGNAWVPAVAYEIFKAIQIVTYERTEDYFGD